jgi:hypothetical protein
MSTVKKYRIYCNDEAITVNGWSETEPVSCFNNNTHTIDTNQTSLLDVTTTRVSIEQTHSDVNDQDSYYLHNVYAYVGPNEVKTIPIDFGVDVNMFDVQLHTNKSHIGDTWSSHINKDTVIGIVTVTDTNTNVITMLDTSIIYIKVGHFVNINDNGYMRVLSKTDTTITIDQSLDVTSGDIVTVTYFMIYNKKILVAGIQSMGSGIIGSFKIPVSYDIGVTYNNTTKMTKPIVMDIETTF